SSGSSFILFSLVRTGSYANTAVSSRAKSSGLPCRSDSSTLRRESTSGICISTTGVFLRRFVSCLLLKMKPEARSSLSQQNAQKDWCLRNLELALEAKKAFLSFSDKRENDSSPFSHCRRRDTRPSALDLV